MKASNIKCKLERYKSTMVICGSYMFECSASKDMKSSMLHMKGGGSREGSDTFMSDTNYQQI